MFLIALTSCAYRVLSFGGFQPIFEKAVNSTRNQGVEVKLMRYVQRHAESYSSTEGGEPLFITLRVSGVSSTTEIALEGTPMLAVRAQADVVVKDRCGNNLLTNRFADSWIYPAEGSIVRTEFQFERTLDEVLDKLAEQIVRWLAYAVTSGKIETEKISENCSEDNLH